MHPLPSESAIPSEPLAPVPILIVEDSEDDVFFLKRALKEAKFIHPVQVATDGRMALEYLAGSGAYEDRTRFPLPKLIFLDLKVPYKSGFEVLAWIRENFASNAPRVIVLSSSPEERDKAEARRLGAHSYLVKPAKPAALRDAIQSVSGN